MYPRGGMPSVFRASALMVTSRISLLALGFGTTVLTARLLQPEGRGAYATIIAALTLFTMCVGAFGTGVALSGAHDEAEARRRATAGAIGIALTLGVLPLLLLLAWRPTGFWHVPALVAAASTPFVLLTSSVQFACLGRGRLGWFAALQLLQPGLLVVAGAFLLVGVHLGLLGATLAFTVSWMVTAAAGMAVLPRLGWRLRLAELAPWRARSLLTFGAGAATFNLLTYFTNRSLLFLVQGLLGLGTAGVFSVATTLSEPVSNMSVALASAAFPRLAAAETRPEVARTFFQLAAVTSLLASTGLMALAALLLVPVFGHTYRMAIYPLPLLLLAYVVLSGREIATFWYVHEQRTYATPIRASAAAFAATLVAAVPLTMRFGTIGAAASAVLGGTVLMTVLLGGLRQRGLALRSLVEPNRETVAWVLQRIRLTRAVADPSHAPTSRR